MIELVCGDSLEVLKTFDDHSIDSIVTDPPYGISFMGKGWDNVLPPTEIWVECIRVLRPGGYLVAMSASRTYHRLAVQLEDLGMICHPMIGWIYGSGFPKATDLSKQFDKGVEREVIGKNNSATGKSQAIDQIGFNNLSKKIDHTKINDITAPATDLAKKWVGYKYGLQSLKPALEPIAVFQKPWKNKDIKRMTDNVEKHGVGAFNIDACRVETNDKINSCSSPDIRGNNFSGDGSSKERLETHRYNQNPQGRHPANLLHDGSEVVEKVFMDQGGIRKSGGGIKCPDSNNPYGSERTWSVSETKGNNQKGIGSDFGSASRFFNKLPITDMDAPFLYTAKPSKRERNQGLNNFEIKNNDAHDNPNRVFSAESGVDMDKSTRKGNQNHHPTVKPIKLMQWLVKLVTPEGGTILDPFMGSGTTGMASEGFYFIGIEREEEYYEIAKARIDGL